MKYASPTNYQDVSTLYSNKSGIGFSVNTPPGSVRSVKLSKDQSSPLIKYIKGYLLILLGTIFITLTLLNIIFGVGEGTLLMHYVSNFGIYLGAVLPKTSSEQPYTSLTLGVIDSQTHHS